MTLNVGINGFGRIGRIILRACIQNPDIKVSAVNDPAVDIDYICYLIKFDSTHGKFAGTVHRSGNDINIDGHKIIIFREKLPTNIPWQIADVQYVVEASGMFTNLEKASGHLTSDGVKRVLVTAPCIDVPMVVLGVNDEKLSAGNKVISCASSTLYCLAPIIKVLEDHFGVSEGFITSIHAMTPSLKPLDGLCLKGKHWRDHRGIHQNIIPASTGACRALGKIIPQVKDKMTGLAFRVPIVNVSVLDITIRLESNTSMEDIIREVENAANSSMQNIIKLSDEQAVSSDFIGETYSCILDVDSSLQLRPDFFKLICWYENEYSYACRIMDSIFLMERQYQLEWKSRISYMRFAPKQSFDQQRECHNKFTYHQTCSKESNDNQKSLCSTSQDSGLKSPKPPKIAKKNCSSRNFDSRKLSSSKKSKPKELFKIWNDVDESVKASPQHRIGSFFHSCVAITPQFNTNTYVKTRERLETVKKEFSKMVIMTENLLKKSQNSKLDVEVLGETSSNLCHISDTEKVQLRNESNISQSINGHYTATKADGKNCKQIHEITSNSVIRDTNNISKSNSSFRTINNVIIVSSSTLTHTADCKEKQTYSNNEDSYSAKRELKKIKTTESKTEIITNADTKNVMPIMLPKCICLNQSDYDNTVDIPITNKEIMMTLNRNEKLSSKEFSNTKEISFGLQTKKSASYISTVGNANTITNNTCEIIDTNKNETDNIESSENRGKKLQIRLEDVLRKLSTDTNVVSVKPSTCFYSSKSDIKHKQDIFDKLDSVSATDSENSFHMKERKSQVINIRDLTNSLEDLERLDKICRIIEISDELSDQLLSALNTNERELKNKKWSFKDLCETIKLDDFCNKMFSKNNL